MKIKKGDIAVYLVVLIVLAVFLSELSGITPVARIYPLFVIAGSFIMVLILLVQAFRPAKKIAISKEPQAKSGADKLAQDLERPTSMDSKTILRVLLYGVAVVVYILLLSLIGYILASILFGVFSLYYVGNRSKLTFVLFPVLFTMTLYIVFAQLLFTRLPGGYLFERLL